MTDTSASNQDKRQGTGHWRGTNTSVHRTVSICKGRRGTRWGHPALHPVIHISISNGGRPDVTCFLLRTHLVRLQMFFRFYLFLERGREGEREGEKHHCVVASHTPPIGDLALNSGMCPDWESNPQPFWFTGQRSIH